MDGPLTIRDAAPLLKAGTLTPSDLLEQCLARIDIYEPKVQAWAYLDRERARLEAAELTDEIKAGNYRGPLHGIPIGIKDIIDVFDMPTGCGSRLWANSYARHDAEVVSKLRDAGALILGKTVTTPYAYLDPAITRNPWNLERTPGGSSSGSAAAVACGMCLAALATQTGGSTIRPAAYCGVYALKPTHGAISTAGVLPLAPSLDHVGIMANCLDDLATVFDRICSPSEAGDPDLPMSIKLLSGDHFDLMSPMMSNEFRSIIKKVMAANSFMVDSFDIGPLMTQIHDSYKTILSRECSTFHRGRFQRHPEDYPPKIAELINAGMVVTDQRVHSAFDFQKELRSRFHGDYYIMPATPDVAPSAETTGDPSFNIPWSLLGMPVLAMPCGSINGLPVAFQLAGPINFEQELISLANRVDRHLAHRIARPPVPR